MLPTLKNTRFLWLAIGSMTLTACTSIPDDRGISEVQVLVEESTPEQDVRLNPDDTWSDEEILSRISSGLSLKDAEFLALQNNPSLRSNLLLVGIAEADYAQAGRMENPGFAYERFSGDDYDASILFDVGGVLLMPLRRQVAARRLEQAKVEADRSVLSHIGDTRSAWIDAVAEKELTRIMERAVESAFTGNNMIRQMSALGHSNVIESAKSEILLSELQTMLAKQRLRQLGATERLVILLGLWGVQARSLSLPDYLPEIPAQIQSFDAVEQSALSSRLDVRLARLNLEALAKNYSLTRKNPFLNAIELGYVLENAEGEKERGYELELRLPLFDLGGVKNEKARIAMEQAQAQAESVAISAASSARLALATYRQSWEISLHYQDTVLPIRNRISQEQLLMYNGMLISVFDLLRDVRAAAQVEMAHVNATRDFWLADNNLQLALSGAGNGAGMNSPAGSLVMAEDGDQGH